MQNRTKRPMSDERRARSNAYIRQYRRNHPEKVKQWRENAILAAAARITAARAQEEHHGDGEGNKGR